MDTATTDTINRQLVLCFQVHQPRRIKKENELEFPTAIDWMDEKLDQEIMERIARTCYIPTNTLLLRLIEKYPQIKIAFSISGLALEQMEKYTPEVIESFRALATTGSVDFLAETYYHSLSFLMESEEFEIQILEHAEKIVELFGVRPQIFRNTDLIYNDDIGRRISMLGFQGLIAEGGKRALKNHNPHCVYEHRDQNGLKILFRNQNLSDDVAFRVPVDHLNLTAEKYMTWLESMPSNEKIVTVALDYETFGEHNKKESGIFDFIENLLLLLAMQNNYSLSTPTEVAQKTPPSDLITIPDYSSIGGSGLSLWVGNEKQRQAFSAMITLEAAVTQKNDPELLKHWRYLQASDHFFYMSDQIEHASHLSPYNSSQEAFDRYMSVIQKLSNLILLGTTSEINPEKVNEAHEAERRNLNTPVWAMGLGQHHPENH